MYNLFTTFFINFWNFIKSKIILSISAVLLISIGSYFFFFNNKGVSYQFITVTQGSINETVSATGNTTPIQDVSLGFQNSGIISGTYSNIGKKVYKGQILAKQNTNDLEAQLRSVQAAFIVAKQQKSTSNNNLDNVTKEQNTLVNNAYNTLLNSSITAISIGDYIGYDMPTVSGTYTCNKEGNYNLKTYSSSGGISVTYSGLEQGSFLLTDIPRPIGTCGLFLSFDKTKILQSGIEFNIMIPNKNAVNFNLNNNNYKLALETRDKVIADARANISTSDSSSIVDAEISQAQANVDSVVAKIKNTEIVSPISGLVTQFDAKIGQMASSGVPLISIIGSSGFEVDMGVAETDIGKINLGDKAYMTLDSFPNETFLGSVFYIAPSETNTQGVITYLIKISFDKNDPRLKSGLTANVDIQTKHKDNVLILPQYAILQNDQGTFIETIENQKVKENPVTLGIQDQKGNVEVTSGVVKGEQVLNIGLKAQ